MQKLKPFPINRVILKRVYYKKTLRLGITIDIV